MMQALLSLNLQRESNYGERNKKYSISGMFLISNKQVSVFSVCESYLMYHHDFTKVCVFVNFYVSIFFFNYFTISFKDNLLAKVIFTRNFYFMMYFEMSNVVCILVYICQKCICFIKNPRMYKNARVKLKTPF